MIRGAVALFIALILFGVFNVQYPGSSRPGWHCVQSFAQGGYDAVTIDPVDHHEIYTWVEESNLTNCSIDRSTR